MAKRIGPSKAASGTTSMREDRARGEQIRREIAESKNGYANKSATSSRWVDTSTTKKPK